MSETRDGFRDYQNKMILLNKVEEEIEKMLEAENPGKRTISKKFDDKLISIIVELEDSDEPKGIL